MGAATRDFLRTLLLVDEILQVFLTFPPNIAVVGNICSKLLIFINPMLFFGGIHSTMVITVVRSEYRRFFFGGGSNSELPIRVVIS